MALKPILTPQSRCRLGVARGDITPPVGIYHRMWGAAEHDRSEGVHRPLTATACAFLPLHADAAARQVLVAVDHCLLGAAEVREILQRIQSQAGVDPGQVTLCFSHTHAAGLLNYDRQTMPGGELIPDYLNGLAETVAGLVGDAVAAAGEADIVYGTGSCALAGDRDLYDENVRQYVCGFNPDRAADQTLLVARATDRDGRLLATFLNYACHPTTLAWDNRLISPDYPGAARELIERETGAPCVFLQGASGDLGPVEGFVGDPAVADRNGRQLGYAALSVFESLPPANTDFTYAGPVVSGALIGVWQRQPIDASRREALELWREAGAAIDLPLREDLPRVDAVVARRQQLSNQEAQARTQGDAEQAAELRALVERETRMLGRLQALGAPPAGGQYPLQAAVWRIGDAIWLAVQGEPYNLLQRTLRQKFPEHPVVVSTIANGWGPSYLPPQALYGQGVYQESIAALAPGSLETLIERLAERIANLLR